MNSLTTESTVEYNGRWKVLASVMVGSIMGPLDASIVYISLPTIAQEFNVPLASVGWVSMAYLLIDQPAARGRRQRVGAALVDERFGRRQCRRGAADGAVGPDGQVSLGADGDGARGGDGAADGQVVSGGDGHGAGGDKGGVD